MADISGGFSFIGSGIGDLFAAGGYSMQAESYDVAARMYETSGKIAQASGNIQQAAATRDIYKVIGGQRADVAGAGFAQSGSAEWLLADSARQGAITQSLIENQTAIDVYGYKTQAFSAHAQAAQARQAASASIFSGILNIGLGLLSIFSDASMKENIKRIAIDPEGRNVYEFNYIGDSRKYRGYIAQELPADKVVDAIGVMSPVDFKHMAVPAHA